jgi:hypothetical protein
MKKHQKTQDRLMSFRALLLFTVSPLKIDAGWFYATREKIKKILDKIALEIARFHK